MTQRLNVLFTTWEGGGNIPPIVETARKLEARGHAVRVMSDACNRAECEAVGARFIAWRRAPSRTDRTPESQTYRDWAAATPQEGIVSVIRDEWAARSLAYAQDVIDELQREAVDLVVSSEITFGTMAACESIGQRFAILGSSISFRPLPGVPPLGPGLKPARTDAERAMHAEITKGSVALFDAGLPALNAARVALGLEPLKHLLDQFDAATVELLATSSAFDFPSDSLPEKVRYVGPQIGDPHWAKPLTSPWPESDTRPLVLVGFSTTFQNHAASLQNVIDALATLPVRVLVTLGGSIKAEELRPSANCVVVESAPHSVVIREAAFVVTHGGHGTVMRGLLSRKPMLVIPHGRDQADNAIRITERGAGLSLMPNASVEDIRAACERLLNDVSFGAAAKRLGDLVAAEAEGSAVVDELEAAATERCEAVA